MLDKKPHRLSLCPPKKLQLYPTSSGTLFHLLRPLLFLPQRHQHSPLRLLPHYPLLPKNPGLPSSAPQPLLPSIHLSALICRCWSITQRPPYLFFCCLFYTHCYKICRMRLYACHRVEGAGLLTAALVVLAVVAVPLRTVESVVALTTMGNPTTNRTSIRRSTPTMNIRPRGLIKLKRQHMFC